MEIDQVFKDILDSDEFRKSLVDSKFQTKYGKKKPKGERTIKKLNFNTWIKFVNKRLFLEKIKFDELKMIIVSSHGTKQYNCGLAQITDYDSSGSHFIVPPTVENLAKSLFDSFGNKKKSSFKKPAPQSLFYDFSSKELRESTLFINVTLTTSNEDMENAICSIHFINEVLKKAMERRQKPIAVLDFRLVQHKNENEISGHFEVEQEYRNIWQTDERFTIINPTNNLNAVPYHNFYKFCNTKYLVKTHNRFIELFQKIDEKGYQISRLYMKQNQNW